MIGRERVTSRVIGYLRRCSVIVSWHNYTSISWHPSSFFFDHTLSSSSSLFTTPPHYSLPSIHSTYPCYSCLLLFYYCLPVSLIHKRTFPFSTGQQLLRILKMYCTTYNLVYTVSSTYAHNHKSSPSVLTQAHIQLHWLLYLQLPNGSGHNMYKAEVEVPKSGL
jgi:hypothetical protein